MANNKDMYIELANRIYDLDGEVYKCVGSSLGRTFTGSRENTIRALSMLMYTKPDGHLLRSELALISNMARTIKNKEDKSRMMTEYNEILKAMEQLPDMSATDIVNAERMALNPAAHWDEVDENAHLVICISRTQGSAGNDIGFELADKLHINYYDESVLNQILDRRDAKEFGADAAKVSDFKRYHGLSKKDASFFRQSALICELAKEEDMIVMGRAADVVLTGQHIPHISIYITAPFAIRVRRMMELKNLDLKQAINLVRKMDHKHQDYYHSFTGKRWGDAINYDLCINSACYGIDESVELIGRLINRQAKLVHRNKDTK